MDRIRARRRLGRPRYGSTFTTAAFAARHGGAYGRFKSILASAGQIDAWHAFEAAETDRALEEWCAENGLRLTRRDPRPGNSVPD